MNIYQSIKDTREQLQAYRLAGECIAFVPTMGNLHEGHLALVTAAKAQADRVVVSIFVNPTQFGVGEDFSSYPRTELEDQAKLQALGVDLLFMPQVEEMYPRVGLTKVQVSGVSEGHCGLSRAGHFDGVATVVSKLFNIVQPDFAFFGEKDFQQLAVIRAFVSDLNMPVDIRGVAIIREQDGLAMSSRNGYLTAEQRKQAPFLQQVLQQAKSQILDDKLDFSHIEVESCSALNEQGFHADYFSICCRETLVPASSNDKQLIILAAAKLGSTRLIDNIQIDIA